MVSATRPVSTYLCGGHAATCVVNAAMLVSQRQQYVVDFF